ncbi:MAG: type III-B CRISPR module RAMP protein Cmr1 [Candidatus Bathyarchaeota archaeon]|nr:type III-B CRISPR module RAMP protein Cmr1 [Candidatus Bathyarchaeota archaeon]
MEMKFTIEAVTPIFIAGADQRSIENEGLRAPSLRGLMRWWFRALAGDYLGDSLRHLKEAESEIFGSSSLKSKVLLRTSCADSPAGITKEYRTWKEATVWSNYVDYLFFSCLDKRKDRRTNLIKVISRPYYPEKSTFEIDIFGYQNELKVALASLWALIYLGGLGFRARRGSGCLKVKKVEGDTYGLNFICDDPKKLEEFLIRNINKALNSVGEWLKTKQYISTVPTSPKYAILSPHHSALFIKKVYSKNWISALDEIGKWYIGQRQERRFVGGFRADLADYNFSHAIGNAIRNGNISSDKERRPYLGLPITYATYKATLIGENFDRRASPLIFGVYEINGNYVPRILLFKSPFLKDFTGNFVIKKKIRRDEGESEITLETHLPNNKIFGKIMKDAFEDLKASNWQIIWGSIE